MRWLDNIDTIPLLEVMPGMRGRFVHSDTMTFAFWQIDAGFDLPEHRHPHEQVTQLLEGTFELRIEKDKRLLQAGAMAIIPGHALHSGKALTFCRILDSFYPKREDYVFEATSGLIK